MAIATITPTSNVDQSRFSDILAGSVDVFQSFVNQSFQQGRDITNTRAQQERDLLTAQGDIREEQFANEIDLRNRQERKDEFGRTQDLAEDQFGLSREKFGEQIRSTQEAEADRDLDRADRRISSDRRFQLERDSTDSIIQDREERARRQAEKDAFDAEIRGETKQRQDELRQARITADAAIARIQSAATPEERARIYREAIANAGPDVSAIIDQRYPNEFNRQEDGGEANSDQIDKDKLSKEKLSLLEDLQKLEEQGELEGAAKTRADTIRKRISEIDSIVTPTQTTPTIAPDASNPDTGETPKAGIAPRSTVAPANDEDGPSSSARNVKSGAFTTDDADVISRNDAGNPIYRPGSFSSFVESAQVKGVDLEAVGISPVNIKSELDKAIADAFDQLQEGDNAFTRGIGQNARRQAEIAVEQRANLYFSPPVVGETNPTGLARDPAFRKLDPETQRKIRTKMKEAFIKTALAGAQRLNGATSQTEQDRDISRIKKQINE